VTFARITGTGRYLPEKVLTNADLEAMVETSDEWIRERTGIRQRHIVADGEATCDLAERAARSALEAAGREPGEVDLIVVATTTPDRVFPSTACLLQARLGVHGCAAFDVQAVCTGFVYALSVVDRFIRTGGAQCALVVGAETISRLIDWTDRGTCVLFGDGAGATIVEPSQEAGIHSTHLHADGSYAHLLHVPKGVSRETEEVMAGRAFLEMKGNEVFKMATNTLGRIVDETLAYNGIAQDEIDWLVPHQANIRIIAATARKLKLDLEHVIITVDRHGNTSAASIPLALDTGVRDGRIDAGDTLLFEAFGGGFTWGSALITY